MRERILRPASSGDLPMLPSLMARAFHDDPVMRWIFPDDRERAVRLPRMYSALLRHVHLRGAATDVLAEGSGPVGIAVWNPPGTAPRTPLRALPALLAATGGGFRRAALVKRTAERAHPREPHWYLSSIATDPAAQRTGVAARLLATRLKARDEHGFPAYLETSNERNVHYYERFGFTVTRELTLPHGGPAVWLMRG